MTEGGQLTPRGHEAEAHCAEHPDRDASGGTCDRCGSFMCGECVQPGSKPPICRPCDLRLGETGVVRHVPVLGVVMMIHGGFVAFGMGAMMLITGGFLFQGFSELPDSVGQSSRDTEIASFLVLATTVGVGGAHLLVGILQMWSGYLVHSFRSRGFAILSLALGLMTVVGCYCVPSSLALLAWGLWLLLREEVRQRFAFTASAAR